LIRLAFIVAFNYDQQNSKSRMKEFPSYSIHFVASGAATNPISEHLEESKAGRVECQQVLKWLDGKTIEVQKKIAEMRNTPKCGPIAVFARLPVDQKADICRHHIFDDLPADSATIDVLKEKVAAYYQTDK
jgi:hypothetical protein